MLFILFKLLHLLAIIIWVGGMFFAHFFLRPAVQGLQPPEWIDAVLAARSRDAAAPTFAPDGLYFLGPRYDAHWGLPDRTAAYDALP